MAGSRSSTRIGDAERAAAQQALQQHLNAGRLQVEEYADRAAAASTATTAPELKVLFRDLPRPHPKLPGSRNLAIIGGVVVLALLGLAAVAFGAVAPGPAPTPAPPAAPQPTIPALPPAPSATRSAVAPTTGARGSTAPLGGATVRRTTGAQAITLTPSYNVDLDDNVSPNWSVGQACCNWDVRWVPDASRLDISNDYAMMTGTPDYQACTQETGYTDGGIERGNLRVGENLCVRTNGHRYALVTIDDVSDQGVRFRATVWDPPFAS